MAEGNIITATFSDDTRTEATGIWQWDYGQQLQIEGLTDLPVATEVHFAQNGQATTMIGSTADDVCVVDIPDAMLQTASRITAYIYLHTDEDDGETEYEIRIPVKPRAQPETYDEDDPEVQAEYTALVQATELLNGAVQEVNDAKTAAETAQGLAEGAQAAAETAQGLAEDAQTAAETAQSLAEGAQSGAENAQRAAEDAQAAAESAQRAAENAQTAAETAQGLAEDAQEAAEAALNTLLTRPLYPSNGQTS